MQSSEKRKEIDFEKFAKEMMEKYFEGDSFGILQIMQSMVETVDVDFKKIKNLFETLELVEDTPTPEYLGNLFYKEWTEKAPQSFVAATKLAAKRKNKSAMRFQDLIFEMGTKIHAVYTSDLCVSTEITASPDCIRCYFKDICKSAKLE